MRFELNILGCGSATPNGRHFPSAQVVNFRDRLLMIDCGECAQWMMRRMSLKFTRLQHIFISHLHGDHCFGLPGLLSTLSLHEKGGDVVVHISQEGKSVLEPMIRHFCDNTSYSLQFEETPPGRHKIYEDRALVVEAFPLYHRVPCSGFIFREKGDNHSGMPAVSYAYCSDTLYDERVARSIEGVDVVYHEATYADDLREKARMRGHSTACEAAMTAKAAGARHLILGHFSKRYKDLTPLLEEAREVFGPNVSLADEGVTFDLRKLASGGSPALS